MSAPSWRRRALEIAALILATLAIAAARVVWSARAEYRAAAGASGDDEIAHLGRAARLYAPGNPYSRRALDKLAGIGRSEPLDSVRALAAWREVRSAILATRSFYTPRRALLDEADAHIAALMADAEHPADAAARARAERWHLGRLADHPEPALSWTLLALFGLVAWIGCAVGFFLRGIGPDDRLRNRPAIIWALGVVAGLTLFFLGLSRA
jgi:hypothetical protein